MARDPRTEELFRLIGQVLGVELGDESALVVASVWDPARFADVFDRYHRVVWRYVARVAGPDVADDVTGEVFVVAFGRRATYDPERGGVVVWLLGIARNLLRTRRRSALRHQRALARAAASLADGPDRHEEAELDATLVALGRLHELDREVLLLYAWDELSYEEIARLLKLPVGTVRSRIARARQRLRVAVSDDVVDPRSSK